MQKVVPNIGQTQKASITVRNTHQPHGVGCGLGGGAQVGGHIFPLHIPCTTHVDTEICDAPKDLRCVAALRGSCRRAETAVKASDSAKVKSSSCNPECLLYAESRTLFESMVVTCICSRRERHTSPNRRVDPPSRGEDTQRACVPIQPDTGNENAVQSVVKPEVST